MTIPSHERRVDAHYGVCRDGQALVVTIFRLRIPAPPVLTRQLYVRCIQPTEPYWLDWGLRLLCAHTSTGEHDPDPCVPEEFRQRPTVDDHSWGER